MWQKESTGQSIPSYQHKNKQVNKTQKGKNKGKKFTTPIENWTNCFS